MFACCLPSATNERQRRGKICCNLPPTGPRTWWRFCCYSNCCCCVRYVDFVDTRLRRHRAVAPTLVCLCDYTFKSQAVCPEQSVRSQLAQSICIHKLKSNFNIECRPLKMNWLPLIAWGNSSISSKTINSTSRAFAGEHLKVSPREEVF